MTQIDISPTVYQRLLRRSESFEDTPDAVIGRLLDEAEGAVGSDGAVNPPRTSAPPGSILPEGDYWLPILRVLAREGGSAPAKAVIDALAEEMGEALEGRDQERLSNGEVRWRNRARFARLRMKERDLLGSSRKGVWEITAAGRAYLEAHQPTGV